MASPPLPRSALFSCQRKLKKRRKPIERIIYRLADETWKDVFRQLFLGNRPISINIPKLSGLDVSQVIKCLSSVCKDAVQRCRDEDFTMLRFISPHLKKAVEVF